MAELHAFFDRDVFIKLACCDLWDEALKALAVTHPYRLASATAKGCRNILKRMDLPNQVRENALARLDAMSRETPVIPEKWLASAASIELYNRLSLAEQIDPGEAQLVVVALTCPLENRLITGDKRFIKAFGTQFHDEAQKLGSSLITFEGCLNAVIAAYGFDYVKAKALPAKGCDKTLRTALGSGDAATEANFRDALAAYAPAE